MGGQARQRKKKTWKKQENHVKGKVQNKLNLTRRRWQLECVKEGATIRKRLRETKEEIGRGRD